MVLLLLFERLTGLDACVDRKPLPTPKEAERERSRHRTDELHVLRVQLTLDAKFVFVEAFDWVPVIWFLEATFFVLSPADMFLLVITKY
jgi:hypothetical protein